MRTSFKAIIIAAGLMLIGANADAQSLKDILNKAANSSTVTEIIEGVTGVKLSKGDIKGTWSYTGSAVKLESSDLIKSATASVAATASACGVWVSVGCHWRVGEWKHDTRLQICRKTKPDCGNSQARKPVLAGCG